MNEPIYQYVKGSGWVVQSTPECEHSEIFYFKNEAGMETYPARFEFRRPEIGEFYDGASRYGSYFSQGKPVWRDWIYAYSGRCLDTLHLKATKNTHYDERTLCVTIVFL